MKRLTEIPGQMTARNDQRISALTSDGLVNIVFGTLSLVLGILGLMLKHRLCAKRVCTQLKGNICSKYIPIVQCKLPNQCYCLEKKTAANRARHRIGDRMQWRPTGI